MSDRYSLMKAYDKLRLMRDKDVLSLVPNTNGWKITDKLVMNRAMFVAPDGSIVASTSNKGTHEQLFKELLSIVSGIDYDDTDDPFYFDTAIYNLLRDYTSFKEWIRLNGGSNAVEQRCYAVLTNWNEGRPSSSQFNVFEDFVNMAYDNKKDYVIVFFGGDGRDVKMFEFKDYMPEDVMRIAKRYYNSGRIYEGLKKKRLKEGATSGVDCVEALLQAMTNLTEAELNEAIEIVIDNPLVNEVAISTNALAGPCFILRDGRYLYSPLEEVVHFDILCELLCGIYYVKIQDDNCDSYEHWLEENGFDYYDVPYEGNIMDYATDILGLVRANSGTIEGMETKLYFVIPPNISTKQVYAMWDFLDKFINEKDDGYQAFFINGANVRWHILCDPVETSSDEFINIVKRYLATGKKPLGEKLNKLNEVYPNKGENKKDFISRFMSVTKKEYPDIKQRYAVANSYWDRRDKVNEAYEEPPTDYGTGEVMGKDIFDRKTHTPFYDRILKYPEEAAEEENLKGEIVMMSPNEYYRECATKIFRDTTIDSIKEQRRWNKDNLAYLTKLVTKYKKKMFMPYINYAEKGQEGLHRMMVAGDLFGWDEKFPVLVVTTYDEERKRREDKIKEEYTIRKMFRDAVDRYRYEHEDEESLREKIMDYISDYYSPKGFEFYDPFTFIMWYHKNDKEYSGYDTCLVFVVANKGEDEVGEDNFSVEVDADGITFWDGEEADIDADDDDGLSFDDVDWDSPYWDDVDLNDPNLDIDALLKKVGKNTK